MQHVQSVTRLAVWALFLGTMYFLFAGQLSAWEIIAAVATGIIALAAVALDFIQRPTKITSRGASALTSWAANAFSKL